MHLFQAKNPNVVNLLKPFLVEEPDLSREALAEMIKAFLREAPEACQCLLLIEDDELKAFVFSFIPEHRSFLFIHQAWADPSVSLTGWPKYIFSRVKAFAESRGLMEIRCETQRAPEAFLRRWGFKEISKVLSFDLMESETEGEEEKEGDL